MNNKSALGESRLGVENCQRNEEPTRTASEPAQSGEELEQCRPGVLTSSKSGTCTNWGFHTTPYGISRIHTPHRHANKSPQPCKTYVVGVHGKGAVVVPSVVSWCFSGVSGQS